MYSNQTNLRPNGPGIITLLLRTFQKLQMSPKERQATIEFKSVASAHNFYKKYQRFMLDLSMIQVTLKPVE